MMAERAWIDVFLVHPAQSADGPLTRRGRDHGCAGSLSRIPYLINVVSGLAWFQQSRESWASLWLSRFTKPKQLNNSRVQRVGNTRNADPQALALSSHALSRMLAAREKAPRARGR